VFGKQTFHSKSISVDHGAAVYIGSGNFTTGGLRSRMEQGLILRGPMAHQSEKMAIRSIFLVF